MCIKVLSAIAALALGFLLIGICYSTFSRFLFNRPLTNLVEYSTYSLMYITFFGAPQILKNKGHISLDVITNALPERINAKLSLAVNIAGCILSCMIFYYGCLITRDHFLFKVKIMDSMGTPQYLLTMAIPIGMFFMAIQFARNFHDDFQKTKSAAQSNNTDT